MRKKVRNLINLALYDASFILDLTCNKSQIFCVIGKYNFYKVLEVFCIKQELPINGQIRAKEVQLIGDNGEKIGVISLNEALEKAEEKNLDLVLVAPNVNPPVCKIMNYGKYKFEQAKKEKEAKKKQKSFEVKEIRVTPNIEEHDFSFKSKNAKKFIQDGNKVKITVRFRGREVNNSKAGEVVLNKFIEDMSDIAVVEKAPKLEGRNMFTILAKKTEK